jgi:hypothetical protein
MKKLYLAIRFTEVGTVTLIQTCTSQTEADAVLEADFVKTAAADFNLPEAVIRQKMHSKADEDYLHYGDNGCYTDNGSEYTFWDIVEQPVGKEIQKYLQNSKEAAE